MEDAISERKMLVKWSSKAPIICLETSKALCQLVYRTNQTWNGRRGCSRCRFRRRARRASDARAICTRMANGPISWHSPSSSSGSFRIGMFHYKAYVRDGVVANDGAYGP
jgi:hypothetical protein